MTNLLARAEVEFGRHSDVIDGEDGDVRCERTTRSEEETKWAWLSGAPVDSCIRRLIVAGRMSADRSEHTQTHPVPMSRLPLRHDTGFSRSLKKENDQSVFLLFYFKMKTHKTSQQSNTVSKIIQLKSNTCARQQDTRRSFTRVHK